MYKKPMPRTPIAAVSNQPPPFCYPVVVDPTNVVPYCCGAAYDELDERDPVLPIFQSSEILVAYPIYGPAECRMPEVGLPPPLEEPYDFFIALI